MENSNQKIIETLTHLVTIAKDGEEGYKSAAADIKDDSMKVIFTSLSNQRTRYIAQLTQQISRLGGSTEETGGPIGALHRTWIDMKSILTSGDKNAIINACVTGDEAAIKNYQEALAHEPIDAYIRVIMKEQLAGIEEAISKIKSKKAESTSSHLKN